MTVAKAPTPPAWRAPAREGPLTGIRVLDLTRAMAGPFCTQLLGDMGAEIVKVEAPGGGDETRRWGPFWNGISCYFMSANRNKKSIVIDLKQEQGRELARTLALRSDVVVENYRPGTMERLGLAYETLAAQTPELIYCSLSGYGQKGPRADMPAYDVLMQGYGGLMGLTGTPDSGPIRSGLPITDLAAGVYAAFGIAAALYRRSLGGGGQKVETSLLESQIAWLSYYLVGYLGNGIIPTPMGSAHQSLTPYQAFRAEDDYLIVAVGNDVLWGRLCRALGEPDLAEDPRFTTNVERLVHRDALESELGAIFAGRPAAEWLDRLDQAGVPCGPIHTLDRIAADEQVRAVGMIEAVPHPEIPDLQLCGIPIKFSATPGAIQGPPPRLGEHTEGILLDLGLDWAGIAGLRAAGVVE